MFNILPEIDMLDVIVDSRKTYSDSPMVKPFYKLSTLDQLQVLADLVRQSMWYTEYPDPRTDVDLLQGDDYTSSVVFLKYLQRLNMFPNSYVGLVWNRKNVDLPTYVGYHFIVVVEDENQQKYIVDTTPDVGYGYGEVTNVSSTDLYIGCLKIDDDLHQFLSMIRYDMYCMQNLQDNGLLKEHYETFKPLFKTQYFNSLLLKYHQCAKTFGSHELNRLFLQDFGSKIAIVRQLNTHNYNSRSSTIQSWKNNLSFLLAHSDDYKSEQKEAQKIVGESDTRISVSINGQDILINHLTPRFFWECGYNVVIVKPSSYLVGIGASVADTMVTSPKNIITSYDCNLGSKTNMGLSPMSYFHPHGMKYEHQMDGPNRVLLVKESASVLNDRKHYVRSHFAQKIANHDVTWFDNQKVLWDPDLNTNLVHSTDDATEACIHFLAAYPEYQAFTRFNYPNPILRKEKKK